MSSEDSLCCYQAESTHSLSHTRVPVSQYHGLSVATISSLALFCLAFFFRLFPLRRLRECGSRDDREWGLSGSADILSLSLDLGDRMEKEREKDCSSYCDQFKICLNMEMTESLTDLPHLVKAPHKLGLFRHFLYRAVVAFTKSFLPGLLGGLPAWNSQP